MADSTQPQLDAAKVREWIKASTRDANRDSSRLHELQVGLNDLRDGQRFLDSALSEIARLEDAVSDEQRRLMDIDHQVTFLEKFVCEGGNSDEFKEGAIYALKEIRRYVPRYEEGD